MLFPSFHVANSSRRLPVIDSTRSFDQEEDNLLRHLQSIPTSHCPLIVMIDAFAQTAFSLSCCWLCYESSEFVCHLAFIPNRLSAHPKGLRTKGPQPKDKERAESPRAMGGVTRLRLASKGSCCFRPTWLGLRRRTITSCVDFQSS